MNSIKNRIVNCSRKALPLPVLFCLFLLSAGSAAQDTVPSGGDEYDNWQRRIHEKLSAELKSEWFEQTCAGICVYDLTAGVPVFEYNARQHLRPASTEKLVTSITALSELGEAYRFTTRICCTGEIKNGVLQGDLYAVGGFDPAFNRDDMAALVQEIRTAGIDSVAGRLCADVSMKDTLKWGFGWCWDDDMPVLTPLQYERKDVFMERLQVALRRAGIGSSSIACARVPASARLLAECSHEMPVILRQMMKMSDNLYAEAMFYQLAAMSRKPYASRRDALYRIEKLVGKLGYDMGNYIVADGSGVSLYNYLTPELEVALLKYAYDHKEIFNPLYESLPVAGKDGTLRQRMMSGRACGNVHAKTGTLEGVSSLAGYLQSGNGHWLTFCIINQGVLNKKFAHDFQDRVCELLCE